MKATIVLPSLRAASDHGLGQTSRGLIWELLMSTGMRARMGLMLMRMRRKKHRKPMMDQRRIWRTEGIVLDSVKIGLNISDL